MHYSCWNKILWLLTNTLQWREELTFKCCSIRKQLLIPKSQQRSSLYLSYFFPSVSLPLTLFFVSRKEKLKKKKITKKKKKHAQSNQNVAVKAAQHNELYYAVKQHHVGPGPGRVGGACLFFLFFFLHLNEAAWGDAESGDQRWSGSPCQQPEAG